MAHDLQNRHKTEDEELNIFNIQQRDKHEREDFELKELTKKQTLKIKSEEMYGKLMNQKQRWKHSDIEIDNYSLVRRNKSDDRFLK